MVVRYTMTNNKQHHFPNAGMHGSTTAVPGTAIGGTEIAIDMVSTEIAIDMDRAVFIVEGKKIKASEIIERLQKLEEMVGVLAENPSAHPALKAAYDKYKTLEALVGEKKDD